MFSPCIVLFIMSYQPRRPPASSPSPPATRYLQHLLPTGRLCTATLPTLPTSVTMQGLTTDIALTGGVYHFLGGVLFSIFRCFVHATGTLMCNDTHRFIPYMLAFCLYPKSRQTKNPTHMSLPTTWWLSFTLRLAVSQYQNKFRVSCFIRCILT
jgi:hypothetical protein